MRIAALMIAATAKNGAGKSTLMHILEGDRQSNEGEILIDGQATRFASLLDSRAAGVVVVHQELALCPTMTIAENIVMSDMARQDERVHALKRFRDEVTGKSFPSAGEYAGAPLPEVEALRARLAAADQTTPSPARRTRD